MVWLSYLNSIDDQRINIILYCVINIFIREFVDISKYYFILVLFLSTSIKIN